jgi:hypothetical protein
LDDKNLEGILRQHIKLAETEWVHFRDCELLFSSEDAVKSGMAQEIGDFAPPPGAAIYFI